MMASYVNTTNKKEKALIESIKDFLVYEANRLVGKASYDELAYSKLKETFDLVNNPVNWKYPTSVVCEDFTRQAREQNWNSAIRYIAAFIFYTGGADFKVITPDRIVVSTKGYYHYIGA